MKKKTDLHILFICLSMESTLSNQADTDITVLCRIDADITSGPTKIAFREGDGQ